MLVITCCHNYLYEMLIVTANNSSNFSSRVWGSAKARAPGRAVKGAAAQPCLRAESETASDPQVMQELFGVPTYMILVYDIYVVKPKSVCVRTCMHIYIYTCLHKRG